MNDLKAKGIFVDKDGKGRRLETEAAPKRKRIQVVMTGEKVRIPIKPLSVNEAWKGRLFRSDAYKKYQKEVAAMLPNITMPDPPYEIHLKFGFSSRMSDWDNPVKPLQDCLANQYGFNDKLIRKAVVETEIVPCGTEYFEFKIMTL